MVELCLRVFTSFVEASTEPAGAAVPQANHDDQVVIRAGDDERQVLVLLVVAVEEDQLLAAVGRIVHGIEVQQQVARRRGVRGDELVDQDVAEPF